MILEILVPTLNFELWKCYYTSSSRSEGDPKRTINELFQGCKRNWQSRGGGLHCINGKWKLWCSFVEPLMMVECCFFFISRRVNHEWLWIFPSSSLYKNSQHLFFFSSICWRVISTAVVDLFPTSFTAIKTCLLLHSTRYLITTLITDQWEG